MSNLLNDSLNKVLAGVSRPVMASIAQASAKTGVDFAYLVKQAEVESSFDTSAQAKTSSARGLYQFIESTWMRMVERYGDKHGGETAGKSRGEILALRDDPAVSSVMAAEFASENGRVLARNYGGDAGPAELYMAHFMGASGASAFLNAKASDGAQSAALLFPAAAKANPNVFYDAQSGAAKSLDEVYARFAGKFADVDAGADYLAVAEASVAEPVPSVASVSKPVRSAPVVSYRAAQAYQSMLANPLDLMLLTQMSDAGRDDDSGDDYGALLRYFAL